MPEAAVKRVGVLVARRMLDTPPTQRPLAPGKLLVAVNGSFVRSESQKNSEYLPVKVPTFSAVIKVSLAG